MKLPLDPHLLAAKRFLAGVKEFSKPEKSACEEIAIELSKAELLGKASQPLVIRCGKAKVRLDDLEKELENEPDTHTKRTKCSGKVSRINPKHRLQDAAFKEWRELRKMLGLDRPPPRIRYATKKTPNPPPPLTDEFKVYSEEEVRAQYRRQWDGGNALGRPEWQYGGERYPAELEDSWVGGILASQTAFIPTGERPTPEQIETRRQYLIRLCAHKGDAAELSPARQKQLWKDFEETYLNESWLGGSTKRKPG
jgi:hypothetical protein